MAIALGFALPSIQYSLGSLSHAGPGLFPFLVSCLLFCIGVLTVVRALLVQDTPLTIQPRNLGYVLGSLCGFTLLSEYLNMTIGIVFLVFFSGLAATDYSISRNVKICVVLLILAFAFQKFLGLNLPLLTLPLY